MLQNGVTAVDRPTPGGFPWPNPQIPIGFVNVGKGREKVIGKSFFNEAEIQIVMEIIKVCNGYIYIYICMYVRMYVM